ncbi:NAD-dependent epimerase/dehydratase family protein [Microbacterium sp. LWO12-1.2]|uniref:NAD-dependent epimerase/dehydratase family protein n=1 Tax=Microbacterium sp. LWO12-1.2 TaxID=3135261 RepID=UPI0034396626
MARVTVVGGAGDVGALVLPLLSRHHTVRVADLRPANGWHGDYVSADVADPASLRTACEGSDTLIFLAMGTKRDWDSAEWARNQFAVNVEGLYSALRAAAEVGVRRFVHASTASIFADYRAPLLPATGDAVDAYGLSKTAAELVCAAATREHDLSGISLRLVGPLADEDWQDYDDPHSRDVMTAGTDVAQAFLAALEAPTTGYRTCMISGDHTGDHIDLADARELLGWRPLARREATTPRENA